MFNRYKKALYEETAFNPFIISLITSPQHLGIFVSLVVNPRSSTLNKAQWKLTSKPEESILQPTAVSVLHGLLVA